MLPPETAPGDAVGRSFVDEGLVAGAGRRVHKSAESSRPFSLMSFFLIDSSSIVSW